MHRLRIEANANRSVGARYQPCVCTFALADEIETLLLAAVCSLPGGMCQWQGPRIRQVDSAYYMVTVV